MENQLWCIVQAAREGLELYWLHISKKRNVLNAYQAINKLCKVIGESIQSKDQENTLSDYEKYLERPPTENKADNK